MEQSNLDSMYAAYKKEFEEVHTVFIKDIGFANWKLELDQDHDINGVYVQEVFVQPNMRGLRYAAKLTDMCIIDCEEKSKMKLNKIFTTVAIGGKTVDLSLRAITGYGFKLLKSDEQLIYFYKELTNE